MKVKNSQKGFTLLEMLVAMAVSGLLLTSVVGAIFQTFRITTQTTPQIIALEDIKSVAYWVGKDMTSANSTTLVDGAPSVNSLGLNWVNYPNAASGNFTPVSHSANFTLSGQTLLRNYGSSDSSNVTSTTVGRHISDIQFSQAGNIITAVITSSPEDRAETAKNRTYQFYLQPKESLAQ